MIHINVERGNKRHWLWFCLWPLASCDIRLLGVSPTLRFEHTRVLETWQVVGDIHDDEVNECGGVCFAALTEDVRPLIE